MPARPPLPPHSSLRARSKEKPKTEPTAAVYTLTVQTSFRTSHAQWHGGVVLITGRGACSFRPITSLLGRPSLCVFAFERKARATCGARARERPPPAGRRASRPWIGAHEEIREISGKTSLMLEGGSHTPDVKERQRAETGRRCWMKRRTRWGIYPEFIIIRGRAQERETGVIFCT